LTRFRGACTVPRDARRYALPHHAGPARERDPALLRCPNTSCTIAESANGIRQLGLSDRALRAILGENAARLVP